MVIGAFPIAKLGALLIKQISKPIANALKEQAKNSFFFRTYICMPPAQFYNWCEVKTKMWILNLGKPVNIPVLNEAMAIELGANLLGEGIIFVIGAGILINEYNRSARKEAAKEKQRLEETEEIQRVIRDLFFLTERQSAEIKEIKNFMYDLESKAGIRSRTNKKEAVEPPGQPPPSQQNVPENDDDDDEIEILNGENDPDIIDKKDVDQNHDCDNSSLLLRAILAIENDLWKVENKPRERGILELGLNHIYRNVYRTQLNF